MREKVSEPTKSDIHLRETVQKLFKQLLADLKIRFDSI
jgi:hypothetical protein